MKLRAMACSCLDERRAGLNRPLLGAGFYTVEWAPAFWKNRRSHLLAEDGIMVSLQTPVCDFGAPAPDFDLPGVDGRNWTRDQCMGERGLLVMFICNHCPYVKAVLDRILRDAAELKTLGVNCVAIMSKAELLRCQFRWRHPRAEPWMPSRRPSPATPAPRWAWPRSPRSCGTTSLKHNPANPKWADRDRFVLSNGHGSMLIYALLHLTGYDLPIDDLKQFPSAAFSKTPGHPEYGYAPGVETTTGPLGQGITNAVGMAIAEKALAASSTARP
jgi:hypothetical protein